MTKMPTTPTRPNDLSLPDTQDRRRHPRRTLVRLCKVRDRRTLLFAAGQTSDISPGGALIRVDRARLFGAGDELDLVVAWGSDAVLPGDSMVRARVKRVTPIDHHHQAIAVEFIERAKQAIAA